MWRKETSAVQNMERRCKKMSKTSTVKNMEIGRCKKMSKNRKVQNLERRSNVKRM